MTSVLNTKHSVLIKMELQDKEDGERERIFTIQEACQKLNSETIINTLLTAIDMVRRSNVK